MKKTIKAMYKEVIEGSDIILKEQCFLKTEEAEELCKDVKTTKNYDRDCLIESLVGAYALGIARGTKLNPDTNNGNGSLIEYIRSLGQNPAESGY